jgi:hypothetical protein
MPNTWIRRLRATLMAVLASGIVALAGASPSLASPANQFPNQRIVDIALSHPQGSWGGQCYVFVNNVLAAASGGRVHIGGPHTYYGAYARAGGVLVTQAQAQAGDIIQISNPANDNLYYRGMHTAIIVKNLGGGNFDVVDSNWGFTEQVHHHHLNPYSLIVRGTGESVQFWRMGQIGAAQAPVAGPAPTAPPAATPTFSVYGLIGNNTLNVRSGPGVQFQRIGSLSEGQRVSITCQTRGSVVVGSTVWDKIAAGAYVSDWYINTPVVNAFTPGLSQCS